MKNIAGVIISFLYLSTLIFAQTDLTSGINLYEKKQFSKAKEVLEKYLDKNEKSAKANFYLGMTYFKLGDLDDAIDYCEEATELEDDNPQFQIEYGKLLAEEIKDASFFRQPFIAGNMKDAFLRAVELDPENLEAHECLASFYIYAPGIAGGDFDLAREQIEFIRKRDEKRGNLKLIHLYSTQGDVEKTNAQYDLIEKKYGIDTSNYYLYENWGNFLLKNEMVDSAIDKFKKQVELAPNESRPHFCLGEAFREKGMLKEALAEYQRALELNPTNDYPVAIIQEIQEELGTANK